MEDESQEETEPNRDPQYFDQVFQSSTQRMSEGGHRGLPRRCVSFVVDSAACEPGTFGEDFEITLQSLNSAQELDAARNAGSDPITMGYNLAKAALHSVNGRALSKGKGEVDFLWEALGQGGRQIVANMFAETLGTASAQKKAKASLRFH